MLLLFQTEECFLSGAQPHCPTIGVLDGLCFLHVLDGPRLAHQYQALLSLCGRAATPPNKCNFNNSKTT